MAQKSRPDPANGTVVSADEYEQLAATYAADGIYGSPADTAVVYADATGRQVKVRAAKAGILRGYEWFSDSTTDEVVGSLPANVTGNPRIDRLVLRLDRTARTVRTAFLQGTAAATPSAPALTQSTSFSSGTFEFPLARWQVASGYTSIAAGDVVNEAWYPQPSGILLCQSTSRPFGAVLRTGLRIFETDTKYLYVYNGTKWLRDPVSVAKVTDTAYTTQTVLQDDPVLQFPLEANSTYEFDLSVLWLGLTSVNYQWAIKFPSGARLDMRRQSIIGSTITMDCVINIASGTAFNSNSSAVGASGVTHCIGTLVTGATAGTFNYQACQGTSSASASTTLRGSALKHRQTA